MGEMADFYIDQMMDAFPEWGSPYSRPARSNRHSVTCKKCGAQNLKWGLRDGRWVLLELTREHNNSKKVHECASATLDDFEVLS